MNEISKEPSPTPRIVHKILLSSPKKKGGRKSNASDSKLVKSFKKSTDSNETSKQKIKADLTNSELLKMNSEVAEKAIESPKKQSKRNKKQSQKMIEPSLLSFPQPTPKTKRKKAIKSSSTSSKKPSKRSKKASHPPKAFYQTTTSSAHLSSLSHVYEEAPSVANLQALTSAYSSVAEQLNSIEAQIAKHALEKAVLLQTLRSITSINNSKDPQQSIHQEEYIEGEKKPTSLWQFMRDKIIIKQNLYTEMASDIINNSQCRQEDSNDLEEGTHQRVLYVQREI
jgi:hypothetical protein